MTPTHAAARRNDAQKLGLSRKLIGQPNPRVAPPQPARSMVREFQACGTELGVKLMPWQLVSGRYITGLGRGGTWLYRRVAIVVARQNGKTEIIKPRTLLGLRLGRRMLHIAQDRLRPRRSVFEPLAEFLDDAEHRRLYGVKTIRFANGQEQILCTNGGSYTILAPTSGGARGGSFDDVFVDEAREFEDNRVDAIVRPTIAASRNPQIVYFSSAGHSESVILNALRRQKDDDPRLAYLEWSAAPERSRDDRDGWAEANPALGATITLDTIEDELVGMDPAEFETERLTRWVTTMQPRLVSEGVWERAQVGDCGEPVRPVMAFKQDPSGTRASAAIAWQRSDGSIALRVEADQTGDPVDVPTLGEGLRKRAARLGVWRVGFDDWTDKELARYFPKAQPIIGKDYANACENFVRVVESGRLRWDLAQEVGADLGWTARKPHESGAWVAVAASDEHPVPAVQAAIRAVWLASDPRPPSPRMY